MSDYVEQTVQDTPVEEKRYTYQPQDESGRPIGGPQVIKYHTQDELTAGLVEQNTLLLRKLRQKTRNERLGIVETENIGTEVPRYVGPVDFSPRSLSNDEYAEIARDLTDPVTAVEAQKRLFEASMGASADQVGETLRTLQEEVMSTRAVGEANAFVAETPEFYKCPENAETLAAYLSRYNLAPIKDNFTFAFNKLNELDPSPFITRPADIPAPVPVIAAPAEVHEPVLTVHDGPRAGEFPVIGLGSGLTRENAGDEGQPVMPVGDDIVFDVTREGKLTRLTGLSAVNAMPGDEYGRRIRNERNFQKKVDALYAAEEKKKRQAAGR